MLTYSLSTQPPMGVNMKSNPPLSFNIPNILSARASLRKSWVSISIVDFSGVGDELGRRDPATVAACEKAPAGVGRRVRGIWTGEMLFREYALSTVAFICNAT